MYKQDKLATKSRDESYSVAATGDGRVVAQMRVSILPPPEELEKYERLYQGTTEILMTSYQAQVNHRIDMEGKVIDSGIRNSARGQLFAFILSMTAIVGGIILIVFDKNAEGLAAIISALVALVGVYVFGALVKKNERIEKSRKNP